MLQQQEFGRLKGLGPTAGPRYERAHPGEFLDVDTNGLDRFQAVGHRIHGNRSKIGRQLGLGKEYLHVAIDDATRLAYAEIHPSQDGPTCAAFLERTLTWFGHLGNPVARLMSDNAKAYTSAPFPHILTSSHPHILTHAGVPHLRTPPYHPQTNGKAERFTQTALRRSAYKRPYRNSDVRNAALGDFLDCYNG